MTGHTTTFTFFPTLPAELRFQIWAMMEPGPRIVRAWRIRIEEDLNQGQTKYSYSFILSGAPAPVTLSICSESRHETLRRRRYTVVTDIEKPVYIDFNRDVIYIQETRILSFTRKEINSVFSLRHEHIPGNILRYNAYDHDKYHSMHDALRRTQRFITRRHKFAIADANYFIIRTFPELKVLYALPSYDFYQLAVGDFSQPGVGLWRCRPGRHFNGQMIGDESEEAKQVVNQFGKFYSKSTRGAYYEADRRNRHGPAFWFCAAKLWLEWRENPSPLLDFRGWCQRNCSNTTP